MSPSHDPYLTKKRPRSKSYEAIFRRWIARLLGIRSSLDHSAEQWRRSAADGSKWAYSRNRGLCNLVCQALLAGFKQRRFTLVSVPDSEDIRANTALRMLLDFRNKVHDGSRPARVLSNYLAPLGRRQLNHLDAGKTRQQHESMAAGQRASIDQLSPLGAAIDREKVKLALAKLRERDRALVEAVIGNGTRVSDLANAAGVTEKTMRLRYRKALSLFFRAFRQLQPPDDA